jgi:hypothetical protein
VQLELHGQALTGLEPSAATIDRRRRPRETEAEAVAFIVSTAIGIRSSVDAADYNQLYDGNADTLRRSLHRIQATAKTILSALPLETPAVAAHETTRLAS